MQDYWEVAFDKEFPEGVYGAEWHEDKSFKCCWSETPNVKAFIRTLLARKEEELLKRPETLELVHVKHRGMEPTEFQAIMDAGTNKARSTRRNYYRTNKEHVRGIQKASYKRNRQKRIEAQRRYYQNNRHLILAKAKEKYARRIN